MEPECCSSVSEHPNGISGTPLSMFKLTGIAVYKYLKCDSTICGNFMYLKVVRLNEKI